MAFPDISRFRNKRILVVGDIMLDEFLYTSTSRTSPEYKDAPVYEVKEKQVYLGGAGNVALNIKKLEAIPYLAGVTGNDANGKTILGLLNQENIVTDYIFTDPGRKTTAKTRVICDGQPVFRIDDEDDADLPELANHFLLKNIRQCITDHKPHAILVQDYNKGVLNTASIREILAVAKENNMPVCVDPKFRNWELYREVELFKPNLKEFKMISEKLKVESEKLEEIAKLLHEKIQFKNLLVTLGSNGNFLFNSGNSQILNLKSQITTPDVCGAGDTVIAAATLGLICGFSLPEIAELANRAGYLACQKKNVQPVTLDELSG